MKKKTQPTIKAVEPNAPIGGASFTPTRTLTEITNEFVSKQMKKVKPSDGDNSSYIRDFATCARMICENMKTFSISDVLALTRNLDTPSSALIPLVHLWIEELKKNNRIKTEISCYEWEQLTFQ